MISFHKFIESKDETTRIMNGVEYHRDPDEKESEHWLSYDEDLYSHSHNDQPAELQSYENQPIDKEPLLYKAWHRHGKTHRGNDKPAVIYGNGQQEWYFDGIQHRENNKPQTIRTRNDMEFRENGRYHRTNGPSIITHGGKSGQFYVRGKELSTTQFSLKYKDEIIKRLKEDPTDIRFYNDHQFIPLQSAALSQDPEVIKLIKNIHPDVAKEFPHLITAKDVGFFD